MLPTDSYGPLLKRLDADRRGAVSQDQLDLLEACTTPNQGITLICDLFQLISWGAR